MTTRTGSSAARQATPPNGGPDHKDTVKVLRTVAKVVEAFGGTAATAEIFGVGWSAVSNWKKDKRFPQRMWMPIYNEAEKRNLHIFGPLVGRPKE